MDLLTTFFNTKAPTLFQNHRINQHIKIMPNQTKTLVKEQGEIGKLNKFYIRLMDKNILISLSLDNYTITYSPKDLFELGKVLKINDDMYLVVYDDESTPNNYILQFDSPTGNAYFTNSFELRITNTTPNQIILCEKDYSIDYSIVLKELQNNVFNLLRRA